MVRVVATRRRTADLVVAGIALAVLVACGLVAHNGRVPSGEAHVFHAINDLPGWLYRPVWPFQQLGTITRLVHALRDRVEAREPRHLALELRDQVLEVLHARVGSYLIV